MKNFYIILIALLMASGVMVTDASQAQIFTDGLVAWYPFNGNANDESGNGNDGTINGNLIPTVDRFGDDNSAFLFDGTTTNVIIDSTLHLLNLGQSQYSVCGWFSISDSSKPLQCIINSIPHRGLIINYNHINVPPNMMSYGIGPAYPEDVDWTYYHEGNISYLQQDQWYFVTLVKSDTNYKFFINAILDHEVVVAESSSYDGEIGFVIGSMCLFGGFGEFFKGKLDDFRFYDRALNESEVQALYETGGLGVEEPVVGSQQFAVTIYPNPSSTQITILTPATPQKNTFMTLYSANGKELISRQITEPQTVVDVSGLSQGIYFVRVVDEMGVMVGKFLKQ